MQTHLVPWLTNIQSLPALKLPKLNPHRWHYLLGVSETKKKYLTVYGTQNKGCLYKCAHRHRHIGTIFIHVPMLGMIYQNVPVVGMKNLNVPLVGMTNLNVPVVNIKKLKNVPMVGMTNKKCAHGRHIIPAFFHGGHEIPKLY